MKDGQNRHVSLAFTVEDIDVAYRAAQALGAEIIQPPMRQPWGAVNMSFYDPDSNVIYCRCFPED